MIEGGQVIVPLASGEFDVFNQKDGKGMPSPTSPASPSSPAAPGAPAAAAASAPPGAAAAQLLGLVISGTKLVPPLVVAASPDDPQLLRVTLGSDDVLTVTSFQREKKPETPPYPGNWFTLPPRDRGDATAPFLTL